MDISSLTGDLIRIRSDNPPGDTSDAIEYISDFLDGIGIRSEIVRARGRKWNLISRADENELLVCGHVDVVPSLGDDWTCEPYSGLLREGFVWGRGASDMKGGCAALLWALKSIVDTGEEPRTNIAFVCDEETGGRCGMKYLLGRGMLPKTDCLIAEPSPLLNPSIGQKGLIRADLVFRGEPGHASLHPYAGRNAISEALALIRRLEEIRQIEFVPPGDLAGIIERSAAVLSDLFSVPDIERVLTTVTYNPGIIRGGEKVNVIAQRCQLELDLRLPWGIGAEEVLAMLHRHAPRATVKVMDISEPNYTPPDASVVKRLSQEIARVTGMAPSPIVQWAASDAKLLRSEGFPVVEYGPGEVRLLHAVDERVSVRSLETTSEIFRGFISSYSRHHRG
ncbi:MAG: ArgE/DapE family deacylase [Methanomicrobiales archaeon]|nr:ArgE/DapE family deacylase [Methanomicrobiales archaeon]